MDSMELNHITAFKTDKASPWVLLNGGKIKPWSIQKALECRGQRGHRLEGSRRYSSQNRIHVCLEQFIFTVAQSPPKPPTPLSTSRRQGPDLVLHSEGPNHSCTPGSR